jgi:hypothetical protein
MLQLGLTGLTLYFGLMAASILIGAFVAILNECPWLLVVFGAVVALWLGVG